MTTQTTTTVKNHSLLVKCIHWGFALFFAYAYSKGLEDVSDMQDTDLLNFEIVFATVFLVLLGLRYLVMHGKPTALSDDSHPLVKLGARLVHIGMYASMAVIAVTGLGLAGLFNMGLANSFWMDLVVGVHTISVEASLLLIGAHILGAVYHRFLGDGVWSSMVPFLKEQPKG